MTRPYKAVFFDLDGTLQIANPSPTTAFIGFARSLDILIDSVTEHQVKLWVHYYWGQDALIQQQMTQLGKDKFWLNYSRLLLEKVNVKEDLPARAQLVRDWFYNQYHPEVKLTPGSRHVLTTLKQAGYHLGLISNRSGSLQATIAQLGLEGIFDLILAAGDIGCWKPNPAIFTHALAQFKYLRAGECLYVGDNYYADALGAQKAGLVPIIFDPDNLYEKSDYRRIRHMNELLHTLA